MFVPLLDVLFNHLMEQALFTSISPRVWGSFYTRRTKLERAGLIILAVNTELKILVKVLVNCLQVVLNHLISPEQTCPVKG